MTNMNLNYKYLLNEAGKDSNVLESIKMHFMFLEIGGEKENRASSHHHLHPHPQQLNSSRPTCNWYVGRRPRTAFTNGQVPTDPSINQSVNGSISGSERRSGSRLTGGLPAGEPSGDAVPGELLPRDPAEGAAGGPTGAGGGPDPGEL